MSNTIKEANNKLNKLKDNMLVMLMLIAITDEPWELKSQFYQDIDGNGINTVAEWSVYLNVKGIA